MSSLFNTQNTSSGTNLFGNTSTTSTSQPPGTGLFQNLQTQSPASNTGKNLFDRISQPASQPEQSQQPTTAAGTGKSLFDRTASSQSQPQQSSSIFSASQAQSTSSAFPSLFSTSQPQQQTSAGNSSLFASAAPQPQQAKNIFGNLDRTNVAQPAAPSLFSSQPQQQAPQNDGQQGLVNTQASQPAYFNSLLEKGKKRSRDGAHDSGLQELPKLQLGLGDIAKRVRELGAGEAASKDRKESDSRAHYLLAASGVNLGATRRDLDSFADQRSTPLNATIAPGWDPDNAKYMRQHEQRLTERITREAIEGAEQRFNAFLEENADINWEEQRKRVYEHFGLTPKDASDDEIGGMGKGSFGHSARRSRANKFGTPGRSTMKRSVFEQSGLQKSVIGTPGAGASNATIFADVAEKPTAVSSSPDDRFLREKQRKYAVTVQELNQARLRKARSREGQAESSEPFSVVNDFMNIESQPGGDSPKQIGDAYKALREIAKEGQSRERQFAQDYLDEMPNSPRSVRVRRQIIDGSRSSLEKAFFDQIEDLVAKNPREANLGGIPTALSKVRAYVRIRAARKDLAPDGLELAMMGDDYCWALLFYLLRSGLVQAAAEFVVSKASHFKTIDRNIITFITAFARSSDRKLEGRIQRDCNNVYSAMTKTAPGDSIDPYRIACYKIIGRCELSRRNLDHINQGVDDWIWLQFNLAREVNRAEESAGDVFGLEEIRETINEIGQRHFQRGAEGMGGFGTFFHLQVLGGMFERAVAYLYSFSYTAAVHFAIALDYYGLLRVADFAVSESELLTYNTKQLPQLSFGRMIGYYTRDFRAHDAEAAVDYLALMCLNADLPGQLGKSQADLCHEALRELVLETREFARLLGDIRSDGSRIKGAIEDRLEIIALENEEEFMRTVTIQAASVADDSGRVADAVLLYHLAEDYDNVVEILCRALSEAQSIDLAAEPARLQPLKPRTSDQEQQKQQDSSSSLSLTSVDDPHTLARNIMYLYKSRALYYSKIKPANRDTLNILLDLGKVRSLILAGEWSGAYEVILNLNLLPLKANNNIPSIRSASVAFNSLPYPISRNIGPILLWTINCISKQREQLAQRRFDAGSARVVDAELVGAARDLMVFAGLVKYRLGERVWEAVCAVAGEAGGV